MMCNKQTMIKTGIGLVAVVAIAYAALPQFRVFILGLSPFLLSLLCPLSMFFMMKGMASHQKQADEPGDSGTKASPSGAPQGEPGAEVPGWFIQPTTVQHRYRVPSPRR